MRNYRCLHTGVPYNTAYHWNRPNAQKFRCLAFAYSLMSEVLHQTLQIIVLFKVLKYTTLLNYFTDDQNRNNLSRSFCFSCIVSLSDTEQTTSMPLQQFLCSQHFTVSDIRVVVFLRCVSSAGSFVFFHACSNSQCPPTLKDFHSKFYPLSFFNS